jgi:hypothetical protein
MFLVSLYALDSTPTTRPLCFVLAFVGEHAHKSVLTGYDANVQGGVLFPLFLLRDNTQTQNHARTL